MRESELINFSINSEDKEFIGITSYGAIWTDNQPKYRFNFNKTFKICNELLNRQLLLYLG